MIEQAFEASSELQYQLKELFKFKGYSIKPTQNILETLVYDHIPAA
jgi:hypothetical protein